MRVLIALLLMCSVAYANDYKIEVLSEEADGGTQYEVTTYKDAINEKGETIKVEDKKEYIQKHQLDRKKADLQAEIDEIDVQLLLMEK